MAAKRESKLHFQTVGQTVLTIQTQSNETRRKRNRKKNSIFQLSELAEEVSNRLPHELASAGDLSVLQTRIESFNVSLKLRDSQGLTLLHAATANNQLDTMNYLIDSGIAIDAVDDNGNTALHAATLNGHIESIHLLLNRNASDSILNKNEDAPLHIAVRTGNVTLVQAFLQHTTINLIVEGYRKRTPLHIAAEHDYVDIVDAFNNCSLVVQEWKEKKTFRLCAMDADKLTPIHFAARCGSARVLDYMISCCTGHGYPIEVILQFLDEENSTPLHAAIDAGHVNIVKVLLKHGACAVIKNGDQIPPIHLACYQGRIDIVQAMVEICGTELIHVPAAGGKTPLHWGAHSIHGGHIISYLIQNGANPNQVDSEGRTALHSGIIYGSLEAVQELVKADQSTVFIRDNTQKNVIHYAVLHKRKAILHYLLQLPCLIELLCQQDSTCNTPLHYALRNAQGEFVMVLVSAIQSHLSNIKDDKGLNYLHLASRSGNWKALNTLLNNPVASNMLNETDSHGVTPLHEAARYGHLRCVELLLGQGAMMHKCYSGFTPFLAAVRMGQTDCAKALFEVYPFQRDWTDDRGYSALHHAVCSSNSSILKLCLDLNIPITTNNDGETFMDIILENSDTVSALVVVKHERWQECLDIPEHNHKPPIFIQLVQTMPDIAKAVLDRCQEKGPYAKEHKSYYETYDFKYLRLISEDISQEDEELGEADEKSVLLSNQHKDDDFSTSVTIKYKGQSQEELSVITGKRNTGMVALKEMLRFNRVSLLNHNVVVQYLKIKWRGYGRIVYGTQLLLFFLQVLFLSSFIIATPPPRLNITDTVTFIVSEESSNTTITEISNASTVLRFFTLFFCLINTVIWFCNLFSIRLEVLYITKHQLMWMLAVALGSTYAFLIPWKFIQHGFSFVYWEAGAIAIFCSWVTLVLYMKPFDVFGVYVSMFLEVLATLIKVSFVCILFVIAFAFSLFILAGDFSPFTSLGDSFFITFSYLLGEINYETYVRRSESMALQHPILTYIFVLLAAALLAVVVMNLLIGLAVGDIDSIKRNALLKQRSDEVRIFTKMEAWLPNCILDRFNKRFHEHHPNKHVSPVRKGWRVFWRALKDQDESAPDLYKILENQETKIQCLQNEITTMRSLQKQRHDELKDLLETIVRQKGDDIELSIVS